MKIKTEQGLLRLVDENANFAPTILRLATVFGLSLRPRFDLVVNRLTAHAVRKGTITIFGGSQWRPNVHVSDVGRAVASVLHAPLEQVRGGIVNVGDNDLNMTVEAIGEAVAREISGTRVDHELTTADDRNYRVSFDRIRRLVDFRASTTLAQGIREISDFLRAHDVDYRAPRFNNS
jgi:nucleoside-diphosphate-sugar epimerase